MKLAEPKFVYILFVIGGVIMLMRALNAISVHNTALFYIGIPFAISFALFHLLPRPPSQPLSSQYWRHMRDATIIMLATSGILQEGFLCVLFFMPIYYFAVTLTYIVLWFNKRRYRKNQIDQFGLFLPALLLVTSFEGVHPSISFERNHSVTHAVIVDQDIDTLKANLALPLEFPKSEGWLLSVFPKPVGSDAGSLKEGDVHTLDFEYRRWIVTNLKRGVFRLRIDEVSEYRVRTSVVENSAYFSSYMNIDGTQIDFKPLTDGQTQVTLTLHYERLLDPAWYFDPLQRSAMQKSADYLMTNVILRELGT